MINGFLTILYCFSPKIVKKFKNFEIFPALVISKGCQKKKNK